MANQNCTWGIALHHAVKSKNNNLKHVVIGRDSNDTLIKINDVKVMRDSKETKKSIDLGSGDIQKMTNNSGNNAKQETINNWKNTKRHPYVLITGGNNDLRAKNLKEVKSIICPQQEPSQQESSQQESSQPEPSQQEPSQPECNIKGFLYLDMETQLSAISIYDYVKTLLKTDENMLVVPVGNYDAHFILFSKDSQGNFSYNYKNVSNFNEAANEDENGKKKNNRSKE